MSFASSSRRLFANPTRVINPRLTRQFTKTATTPGQSAYKEVEPATNMSESVKTAAEWVNFGREHVTHGLGRLRDHVVVKGEGCELITADGKRLLDFTAGIGVTNLGHCHPHVSAAAAAQVNELVHLQCSIAFHQPYLRLIEKLLPTMPHPSLDQFFFWNSGSEAVEAAIKVARKATGKQNIICFQGAYHGRTYGSGALTKSKTIYMQNNGPVMPGVFTSAYPYWHGLGVTPSTSEEELVRLAKHQLDLVLRQQVHPSDVAAIFIEPVQGEGGYVPCPPAFMRHLREVCDKHNILLVVDEVQTGFFRTGSYFAVERTEGLRPDIMIFAKGVANGFPLSGIVSTKEIMGTLDKGSMGGTYAGNAVACAAGIAAQEVFQKDDIAGNVQARSKQLFTFLNELKTSERTKHLVADVRGWGLMTALEFRNPVDPLTLEGLPEGTDVPVNIGKKVQDYCLNKDLLLLTTSCFDTIRFIPPLVITEKQMDSAIGIIREAIETVVAEGEKGKGLSNGDKNAGKSNAGWD